MLTDCDDCLNVAVYCDDKKVYTLEQDLKAIAKGSTSVNKSCHLRQLLLKINYTVKQTIKLISYKIKVE